MLKTSTELDKLSALLETKPGLRSGFTHTVSSDRYGSATIALKLDKIAAKRVLVIQVHPQNAAVVKVTENVGIHLGRGIERLPRKSESTIAIAPHEAILGALDVPVGSDHSTDNSKFFRTVGQFSRIGGCFTCDCASRAQYELVSEQKQNDGAVPYIFKMSRRNIEVNCTLSDGVKYLHVAKGDAASKALSTHHARSRNAQPPNLMTNHQESRTCRWFAIRTEMPKSGGQQE